MAFLMAYRPKILRNIILKYRSGRYVNRYLIYIPASLRSVYCNILKTAENISTA